MRVFIDFYECRGKCEFLYVYIWKFSPGVKFGIKSFRILHKGDLIIVMWLKKNGILKRYVSEFEIKCWKLHSEILIKNLPNEKL